jgi:hypothetical protein
MGDEWFKAQTQTVFLRNRMGQFIKKCEKAAEDTARLTAELGARTATEFAPKKSGHLASTIEGHAEGNRGSWSVSASYWPYVEFDTAPHIIYGKLVFPYKGGLFVWDNPHYPNNQDAGGAWVNHPGTDAQPFMIPSYEVVSKTMMDIARLQYPG